MEFFIHSNDEIFDEISAQKRLSIRRDVCYIQRCSQRLFTNIYDQEWTLWRHLLGVIPGEVPGVVLDTVAHGVRESRKGRIWPLYA